MRKLPIDSASLDHLYNAFKLSYDIRHLAEEALEALICEPGERFLIFKFYTVTIEERILVIKTTVPNATTKLLASFNKHTNHLQVGEAFL
jgi:hypothetical protein